MAREKQINNSHHSSTPCRPLGIVCNNLNLNPHVVFPKPCDPDTSPDRLVPGHILFKVADHGGQSLVVDGHVVRVHSEHLFPALSPGVLQVQLDVGKGLVDLLVDLLVEDPRFWVPSACARLLLWKLMISVD